jgi:hypothetical protein
MQAAEAAHMITMVLLTALYFLPTLIAAHRGHRVGGMLILNLLFGWTGVAWLVLMLWAFMLPRVFAYAPVGYAAPRGGGWDRF